MTEPIEAGASPAPDPNISAEDFEAFRPSHDGAGPKVLQLLPALVSGGVERGTVDMARALAQAGWQPLVASRGGPMVHELERVGATHFTLPVHSKNPLTWRATFDALVDLIHRERVDLVHARSRIPAWLGWRAAVRNRIPFITTFHQRPAAANALKRAYNSVMVRGERVIAISHYIAERLIADYAMDPARLRVIQRGVDLDMFDPDRVPAERLVRLVNMWRLPDGLPVVMMPGRITHWKGHEQLIDALATLDRGSFHCLLVGEEGGRQDLKARMEARARAAGIAPYVHFVGRCDDMPAAYKLADVVVSASQDPEPFGRVMIEAQAMGRPIVATDHGGARETVIQGETGWLVRPGDTEALANGLRLALGLDEAARARLAAQAIAHVRAEFSRYQMCARTLAVYTEVLSERGCERL